MASIYSLNIFSFNLLPIPVHLTDHWILVVVNNSCHSILSYDSDGGSHIKICQKVQEYLSLESKDKSKPLAAKYEIRESGEIPQQVNGDDCGLFVLLFARKLLRGQDLQSIDPHDTRMSRLKVAWEIANLALLRDTKELSVTDKEYVDEKLLLEETDDDELVLQMDETEEQELLADLL